MNIKHRKYSMSRELKIALLKRGYNTLKEWVLEKGYSYKLARAVVVGYRPAKSGKSKEIKDELKKEFPEIFKNID